MTPEADQRSPQLQQALDELRGQFPRNRIDLVVVSRKGEEANVATIPLSMLTTYSRNLGQGPPAAGLSSSSWATAGSDAASRGA